MVNLVFIVIVFYKFLGRAVKLVKILYFKFFEINLNIILEFRVYVIYSWILIESI